MRFDFKMRPLMVLILAGGLAACDSDSLTQPRTLDAGAAVTDLASAATPVQSSRPEVTRPARTQTRPQRPDTVKRVVCRGENELTPAEIAQIRALYNAYLEEVGGYQRLIAALEQQVREAIAAGAPRERIEVLLAQIERAKQQIAEATARLRAAIKDILHDDRLPCFVVTSQPVGGR